MSEPIEMHPDPKIAKGQEAAFAAMTNDLVDWLETSPPAADDPHLTDEIQSSASEARNLLGCLVASRASAGKQLEALLLLDDLYKGTFLTARPMGTRVSLRFNWGLEVDMTARGPTWRTNAVDWLHAWATAAILRDDSLREILLDVSATTLTESQDSPYRPPLAAAEALMRDSRSDRLTGLQHAVDLCDQVSDQPPEVREFAKHLWAPTYRTWVALTDESKEYAGCMRDALRLHEAFYTVSEERAKDPNGFFSLLLTGAASLAYDAGLHPAELQSSYLPEYMVVGALRTQRSA